MASLTPQATGSQLGSRNPFAAIVSAQNTGSSSQANIQPLSPSQTGRLSSERADEKRSSSDVTPPSSPAKQQGALNSPTNSTGDMSTISRQFASASNQHTGSYLAPEGPPPSMPMPPTLPPRTSTDSARLTSPASNQHRSSTFDMLNEELPPAYTPGPNSREGEQTVDFGPVRPFMPAQPNRQQPQPQQQQYLRPQPLPQQQSPLGFSGSQFGLLRNRSRGGNESSLSRMIGSMLIDYITAPREEERHYANTPGSYGQPQTSGSPQPLLSRGSIRSTLSSARGGNSWSQYPGISRAVTPPPTQSLPPNDGKPTVQPTPGHPLIKDGKVLVYPIGHECRKCYNRGYRPASRSTFENGPRALAPGDPNHPCKKCWSHYSRVYDASIARLDWTGVAETNFQRPIAEPSSMPPSTSSPFTRNNNLNRGPSNVAPLQPQLTGGPVRWAQRTPGGTTTYEPGDPRIGGRLCPRCRGDGSIRIFILEIDQCPMCGGLGRVF